VGFWHTLLRRLGPPRTGELRRQLLAEILADERARAGGDPAFAQQPTPLPALPSPELQACLARGTGNQAIPVLRPRYSSTAEFAVTAPEFDDEVQTTTSFEAEELAEDSAADITLVDFDPAADPDFTEPELVIPPYLAALAAERDRRR
jgi:hypothetical protein